MTVDEAIGDLLSISTDIRRLVVLEADGEVIGAGPAATGAGVGAAVAGLWRAAEAVEQEADEGSGAPVDHVVVDLGDAAIVSLQDRGRRIVALTAADPPLGLVLFDLRTCLADAFPDEEGLDAAQDAGRGAAGGGGTDDAPTASGAS